MSHSDELDVLSADTVSLLSDVQAALFLVTTLGSFNTATMKNTPTIAPGVDVDCVRFATRTIEAVIDGVPKKVKETPFVIRATGLSRAPAENDRLTVATVTYRIVHVDTEIAGRQYRLTCRELG